MANLLPPDFNFDRYMRDTECKAKVRRAGVFAEELVESFRQQTGPRFARMESTKLRKLIEFRPGELTVWGGYNGHRKSMFLGQAVLDFLHHGDKVLIASMEMPPAATLHRMARQACGTGTPFRGDLDRFVRWTDQRLWIFDHAGRVTPDKMLAVLGYFGDDLGGQHVVIDSLMMVCGSEEHLDEQKQLVTDLVRSAQELAMHVHLVAHMRKPASAGGEEKPPGKYDLKGSSAISDQAANVIAVWANKEKEARVRDGRAMPADPEPDALVSVLKQRNGEGEGAVKLWFDRPSMRFVDDPEMRPRPYGMEVEE